MVSLYPVDIFRLVLEYTLHTSIFWNAGTGQQNPQAGSPRLFFFCRDACWYLNGSRQVLKQAEPSEFGTVMEHYVDLKKKFKLKLKYLQY